MKTPERFNRILAQVNRAVDIKSILYCCGGMAVVGLGGTYALHQMTEETAKENRHLMDQAREQVQHLFDQQEMTLQCEQTEFSTQHNYVCDTDVCWLGKTVNTVNFLCDTKKVTCDNNNPNGEMACKEAEENN